MGSNTAEQWNFGAVAANSNIMVTGRMPRARAIAEQYRATAVRVRTLADQLERLQIVQGQLYLAMVEEDPHVAAETEHAMDTSRIAWARRRDEVIGALAARDVEQALRAVDGVI